MRVLKINNLFSQDEFNKLVKIFKDSPEDNENFSISEELGRYQFHIKIIDEDIRSRLMDLANSVSDFNCGFSGATAVEYNPKYGIPSLPTHLDGDCNDLIINYQMSSNVKWNIGIDRSIYDMNDNDALLFNPNKCVHWRPRKTFKDGEFIRLIFFRFYNLEKISDYSHLRYWPQDEVFKEINKFRDSVSQ